MASIKVRYLVAKKQKGHTIYYWQPWSKYRSHFMTMPLGRDLAQAIIKAEKYNKELNDWRKSGIDRNLPREGTVRWLADKYKNSPRWNKLKDATQKGYSHWIKWLVAEFGDLKKEAMTRRVCKDLYDRMYEKSPHNANAMLRFLRTFFSWAKESSIVEHNYPKDIRLIGTDARNEVWDHVETEEYIKRATDEKRRSIALAVILAENTGQREGDILRMQWGQYDGQSIKIRQGKTNAYIEVPCTVELKRWLDNTDKTSTYMVVSESTKQPYKASHFQRSFLDIKSGTKITKWFMDFRRTAVVRLAEAGCTIPQIASITGHSIETCTKILEVYLPRNATMARAAIKNLERHRKKSRKEIMEGEN